MKKLFTLCSLILMTTLVFAQSPEKMSYQAVVRDGSNSLITSSLVSMQISILQDSASGTAVYVETQTQTSNNNGLVTIEIGAGTIVSGSFSAIDWNNGPYFIKVETDPTGGSSYTITGTSQLLSVPYALHAKTAESIIGGGTGGSFTHYIGEEFGGGVIFHLFKDNQGVEHGLIVSLVNISTSAAYGLSGTDVPNCESHWNGLSNTIDMIMSGNLPTEAAGLCVNYNGNGFTDWFLPAIDQLDLLFKNRYDVNRTLRATSGAVELSHLDRFWSSTEVNSNSSLVYDFFYLTGYILQTNKLTTRYVRAIRTF